MQMKYGKEKRGIFYLEFYVRHEDKKTFNFYINLTE